MKIKILVDYLSNLFVGKQTKQTKIYLFGILIEELITEVPDIKIVDFSKSDTIISVNLISIINKELYHIEMLLYFDDSSIIVNINREQSEHIVGKEYVNIASFTGKLNNRKILIEEINTILTKKRWYNAENISNSIFDDRYILINNVFIIEKYFNNYFTMLRTIGFNIVIDKLIKDNNTAELTIDITKDNSAQWLSIKLFFDKQGISIRTGKNSCIPNHTYHLDNRVDNLRGCVGEIVKTINNYIKITGENN